jgi:ParB family transcriptional regulator, chromosome partitioning protein
VYVSKRALGKGIDALLSGGRDEESGNESIADNSQGERVLLVPLSKVKPNPQQPRKEFSEEALSELADSIRSQGILQPLIVEKRGEAYHIIAGERRFRAAEKAGVEELPVLIRSFSSEERLEIALIENIQREDLTPLEEASAYEVLVREKGLSQEEVAKKVGKKRSTIANSLRLLKMPEEMRDAVNRGDISAGHARAILSVTNPLGRDRLYRKILDQGLSVRRAEEEALRQNTGGAKEAPENIGKNADTKGTRGKDEKTPILKDLEQGLIDTLGTKVSIRGSEESGEIVITYFTSEDLERVLEIIQKS